MAALSRCYDLSVLGDDLPIAEKRKRQIMHAQNYISYINTSGEARHEGILWALYLAVHYTHFAANPRPLKESYIDASLGFVRRAQPPLDIGNAESDIAAYLHGWLYHDKDKHYMKRFKDGLEVLAQDMISEAPVYAQSLSNFVKYNKTSRILFGTLKVL